MGPTERLERAIDRLTTYGWTQGDFIAYAGEPGRDLRVVGMCAVGALAAEGDLTRPALIDMEDASPEAQAAAVVVLEAIGLDHDDEQTPDDQLELWNDASGRQLHEVIGALALAAEISRRREFVEEPEPVPA